MRLACDGRYYPLCPALLCPGWTVHAKSNKDSARMRVLNSSELPKFLMGRPLQNEAGAQRTGDGQIIALHR